MAVYVDAVEHQYRRMKMCHMWADTRQELFNMATTVGVDHKWFQRPDSIDLPGMTASWEHFDISLGKKRLAIAHGAVLTDKYGPIEFLAKLDLLSSDVKVRDRGARRLAQIERIRER